MIECSCAEGQFMKQMKISQLSLFRKSSLLLLLFIGVSLLLPLIEARLRLNYGLRSLIKSVLFIGTPLIFTVLSSKALNYLFLQYREKPILKSLLLGFLIYIIIIVGFTLIQPFLSLDTIKASLLSNVSVNKENFLYVAVYISFVNSWIEEFFFRGVGYFNLRQHIGRKTSMIISSILFALYHISIVRDWAHPILVGLSILGLFFVGIFFILLNEANQTIYKSWVVHMFANLAINTIGLHMFGFIQIPFLM